MYNLLEQETGVLFVARVTVRDNEQLDDALRRFKRQVLRNGTQQEKQSTENTSETANQGS